MGKGEDVVITFLASGNVTVDFQATDLLLDQMKTDRMDFSKIAALSGSGQVHRLASLLPDDLL